MAEDEGFEPPYRFPHNYLSKVAHSTALPIFQNTYNNKLSPETPNLTYKT